MGEGDGETQTERPPGTRQAAWSRYKTTGSGRGCGELEAKALHSATQLWWALPWGKLGSVLPGLQFYQESGFWNTVS